MHRGGAAIVIDKRGHLIGIFTDGDFRRSMIKDSRHFNDPVKMHMTSPCKSLLDTTLVFEAQKVMGSTFINALPIINARGKVVGMLDIQDLVI